MNDDSDLGQSYEMVGLVDLTAALLIVFMLASSLVVVTLLRTTEVVRKSAAAQEERIKTFEELQAKDKDEDHAPMTKRYIIPNELNGKVFFDIGQSVIRREFYPTLERISQEIGAALQEGTFTHIQIEGHTDDRLVRSMSKYKDNWELGAARALAVLRYFVETGMPTEKISAVSYGEYRPLRAGQSNEARAENRRIEVILLRYEGKGEVYGKSGI